MGFAKISIPVIGNGDIETPDDAKKMLEMTGCDLIMIGRGSLGNPWIFSHIKDLLENKEIIVPTIEERITLWLKHLHFLIKEKGEYFGVLQFRKHLNGYVKDLPGGSKLYKEIVRLTDITDIEEKIHIFVTEIMEQLKDKKFKIKTYRSNVSPIIEEVVG